ncbi:hypothetical protein [Nocardioides daphniae]|uniref:Uncharacterized protein n=1 Tax=Nocardioides daphniae TaxID=402297 RepID=A0A4P7UBQ7_9ACTN|nr:hypothetical protein [Nocardioides daphniae]QCC76708.1 hypothetical protein E2C04_04790 [Nocardioides daphniae]GGD15548.1 hypothetical protein GCM10007231_13190 [Nocardioides daphniae]
MTDRIRAAVADYLGVPPAHLGAVEFTAHRRGGALKSLEGAQFRVDFTTCCCCEVDLSREPHKADCPEDCPEDTGEDLICVQCGEALGAGHTFVVRCPEMPSDGS